MCMSARWLAAGQRGPWGLTEGRVQKEPVQPVERNSPQIISIDPFSISAFRISKSPSLAVVQNRSPKKRTSQVVKLNSRRAWHPRTVVSTAFRIPPVRNPVRRIL